MAKNKQQRRLLYFIWREIRLVIVLPACFATALSNAIAFFEARLKMDWFIFGIWPADAVFFSFGLTFLVVFIIFLPFGWDTVKEEYWRRQKKTGKRAIRLLLKYRKAVISPQSSPRYLPNIELLGNQVEKLKLRHAACKTVRELEEHIQTLIPYLEEIGLKRTQKEVKGWSL